MVILNRDKKKNKIWNIITASSFQNGVALYDTKSFLNAYLLYEFDKLEE